MKKQEEYIYIAGPLFNAMELEWNERIAKALEDLGLTVYLPQRDGGEAVHDGTPSARRNIFIKDVHALKRATRVVAILDGRVPDEGTMIEIGIAYAQKLPIHALRTDHRSFMRGHPNIMLQYTVTTQDNTIASLIERLRRELFLDEWAE